MERLLRESGPLMAGGGWEAEWRLFSRTNGLADVTPIDCDNDGAADE